MGYLTLGSLFTGFGGLDRAVHDVFGTRTAWTAEINPAACKVIDYRMPGVPNHGDVRTLTAVAEPVDVLAAGYPCQGESTIGLRRGVADPRWLWPVYRDTIARFRPVIAVGENVEAHRSRSFHHVLADLLGIGYTVVYAVVAASDVGACHRRERLFWMAWPSAFGAPVGVEDRFPFAHLEGGALVADGLLGNVTVTDIPEPGVGLGNHVVRLGMAGHARRPSHAPVGPLLPSVRTSDANGMGLHGTGGMDLRTTLATLTGRLQVVDGFDIGGAGSRFGPFAASVARWESLTRLAPDPTAPDRNGNPRLTQFFAEWLMGVEEGWFTGVPGISRGAAIRLAGNGVVWQQGAAAIRWLLSFAPVGLRVELLGEVTA